MSFWTITGLVFIGLFLIKAFMFPSKKKEENGSSIADFNQHESSDSSNFDQ